MSGRGVQDQQDKLEREIEDDIEMLGRVKEQETKASTQIEELNLERTTLSKTKDHKDIWKKKIVKLKSEIEECDKEV